MIKKMYHIGLDDSLEAKYAILPGDPGRVQAIAEYLEDAKFLASNREYTSYVGQIEGAPVLIMSTGMGGPSTAIAMEELHQLGVHTVIRVGTCGGMDLDVVSGDLVIAQGSIRMEGTTREYVPIEFPALADFEVTNALVMAARKVLMGSEASYHVGVVHSKDSFYGQHDPDRMPVSYELEQKWSAWLKAGTLASEMESAALFIVGHILGMRTGCVLNTLWNKDRERQGLPNPPAHYDMDLAIRCAVEAVRELVEVEG